MKKEKRIIRCLMLNILFQVFTRFQEETIPESMNILLKLSKQLKKI